MEAWRFRAIVSVSKHSDYELRERIRKGKIWLEDENNDNHVNYERNLALYELLVKEAEKRGIFEEDCWKSLAEGIADLEEKGFLIDITENSLFN